MQGASQSLSTFDTRELEPCTALVALCHSDFPPVCVRDLFDDPQAEPGPILIRRVSCLEYVLTVRLRDTSPEHTRGRGPVLGLRLGSRCILLRRHRQVTITGGCPSLQRTDKLFRTLVTPDVVFGVQPARRVL